MTDQAPKLEVSVNDLVGVFRELYPRELDHVVAEIRARRAENELAAFREAAKIEAEQLEAELNATEAGDE
jgi:hypothetical protein